MSGLYTASVVIHLLALAVWLGGAAFLGMVLVPVLRRPENRALAPALFERAVVRFRIVGWVSLALIVLTGAASLLLCGVGLQELADGAFWASDFGEALLVKLCCVFLILVLSAAHDFVIGPRALALWRSDPDSPRTLRLRRASGWIGRGNLLLAIIAIVFAVKLARGMP
jgi:putative copper export protein